MKIEFSGAAQQVTGSKHLLHINGKKVLLDCGLFQGNRKKADIMNRNFPYKADEIDVLILSHSHIDHSGLIPLLVKKGFTGTIFCTHATRDLCSIMLPDSAHIQEKDFEWMKKKKKQTEGTPLYTMRDAEAAMTLFRSVPMNFSFEVVPGVKARFLEAGHVLGSAMVELEIDDRDTGQHIRLGFTGDLGRADLPILKDPAQLEGLDVLITESTYGNRLHNELKDVEDLVAKTITDVYKRGGKIIVPAFSVGRTQEVLYVIRELQAKKKIPLLPVFVDSPLSAKATGVFRLHPETFDPELRVMLERGQDPFCDGCEGVQYTASLDESKALNSFPGPCIIISASGMCEAGRIRHHLANHITDPKNMVLVVGFMAENTLGRKIVDRISPVNIFGEPHTFHAEVQNIRAFSGHADQTGLLNHAAATGSPKQVFLVHGETESMKTYKEELLRRDSLRNASIEAPRPGDVFLLRDDKTWTKSPQFNPISRVICEILEC